jgi:hypothetical protein
MKSGFSQIRYRQDLQQCVERGGQLKLLFNDGNQQVGVDGAPDLLVDGVLARDQKPLAAQVLLHPFEEQLDRPAMFAQRSDHRRRQMRAVDHKHPCLACLGVFEANATQLIGIVLGILNAVKAIF